MINKFLEEFTNYTSTNKKQAILICNHWLKEKRKYNFNKWYSYIFNFLLHLIKGLSILGPLTKFQGYFDLRKVERLRYVVVKFQNSSMQ